MPPALPNEPVAPAAAREDRERAGSGLLAGRGPLLTGLAIFVVAAALRLSLVETARFTGDEARDYATGMDIAHGVRFPALGPAIAGSHACCLPGPLYNWMAAFPQLVTRAPEAGNVFFELLSAATVWMFWFGLRGPFGERAAAFAGMLMALSPWSALFGDRVWNPHAFLFFEVLAFVAVLRLREEPGSRWAIALPVACLAMPQVHLAAPIVWLALLPLVRNVRLWNRRYLALGTLVGLALYIPFAIHEVKTGFGVTHSVLAETFSKKFTTAEKSDFYLVPIYALRLLTLDVTYHELTGYWGGLNESAAWHALWFGSAARPFHVLRLAALVSSLLLLVSAAAVALAAPFRTAAKDSRSALRLFAWSAGIALVADMLLLAMTGSKVFANYVTPVFPFIFVLYAYLGLKALTGAGAWGPRVAATVAALALVTCAGGVEATLSISRRIDGRNGLAVHRAVSRRVLDDCAAAGRPIDACPARLDFGFMGMIPTYGTFARRALGTPIRWEAAPGGLAYRLQKREDPAPPGAAAFPITEVGPVKLYRLR